MECRNSGLDDFRMSFSDEYKLKTVCIDSGPGLDSDYAKMAAEDKLDGYEAIWAFYDDSHDEYEVLCVKKKESL